MTDLANALQRAKIADWDAHEQEMAARFKLDAPVLGKDLLERVDLFAKWTQSKFVRKCPARPPVVATFLLEQHALGASPQTVISMLEAIDAIHQYHGLSSPCATRVVNYVLDQIVKVEPPRSWDKDERAEWAKLPPLVRTAITRRERDRDRALRNAQHRAAESKTKRHNGADESVKQKEVEHHGQAQ